MSDILSAPVNGSGYNPEYGLLGSNRATDDDIKLFPKMRSRLPKAYRS